MTCSAGTRHNCLRYSVPEEIHMGRIHTPRARWTAVALGLTLAAVIAEKIIESAWGGQEEQFTPRVQAAAQLHGCETYAKNHGTTQSSEGNGSMLRWTSGPAANIPL